MFGSARADAPATRGAGGGIYVVVEEADAHSDRARAAGAEILRDVHDTEYGSRDYSARDPEGNVWHFGTYQPFDFDHANLNAASKKAIKVLGRQLAHAKRVVCVGNTDSAGSGA